MTYTQQPKLSIIIAAWNNTSYLKHCLVSLEEQVNTEKTEVIVISNYDGGTEEMKRQFSFTQFVRLDQNATVPELRAQGILRSTGKIVALLEDHCTFGENWHTEIEKAHELSVTTLSGANVSYKREALEEAAHFYREGFYDFFDKI